MQELLRRFNGDMHTKEALKEYFTVYLESKIIERAKEHKPVDSLADAILELNNAFIQLDIDYGIKTQSAAPENTSR